MTNKQLPFTLHQPRTLYDWAKESGWNELRYDEKDIVWRGFAPGSYIEEEVPMEVLLDFMPIAYVYNFQEMQTSLMWFELKVKKLMADYGIRDETKDVDLIEAFIDEHPQLVYTLALARHDYDLEQKKMAWNLALDLGLRA